jgi:HEPN domain-containing protein
MKRLTGPWVRKAENDYIAAKELTASSQSLHDQVCFHCQQAAEKYFKALLQELGLVVPKVHDLETLLAILLPHDQGLQILDRGLDRLTSYAVDYRYPGFRANAKKARAAMRVAERVRKVPRPTWSSGLIYRSLPTS